MAERGVRVRKEADLTNHADSAEKRGTLMRLLLARYLVAVLSIGALTVSHVAKAQTDSPVTAPVLFGNDGLSSRNLILGGVVSTGGSVVSHEYLAQGFTVGDFEYQLESIDIGLYLPLNAAPLKIQLFSSTGTDGDEIPNVPLGTFNTAAPTNNGGVYTLGGIVVYNFSYLGDTILQAGEQYWIVVSYDVAPGVVPPVFNWHYAAAGSQAEPTEQNGSGITYLGTVGTQDIGGQWLDYSIGNQFQYPGLRIGVRGTEPEVIGGGGGGGSVQTPPTLDCYALSKGFFKNKYPSGWPASVIANGGTVIGGRVYTIAQLRTMLDTNSTRGNQIGQLASQLVAVHLSRALAIETAGPQYIWWDGWAPESTEAKAAYDQAALVINANAGFDYKGRLTGCVSGVSNLIDGLDGYIEANHCDSDGGGSSGGGKDCGPGGKDRDKDKDKGKGWGKGHKDKGRKCEDDDRDRNGKYRGKNNRNCERHLR